MNKKTISSKVLDSLVDRAIYDEAKEENIEFGHALKELPEKELTEILNSGKKRKFNKILWERVEWSIAVAALIAIAIAVPISVENNSKDKICNIVYAYNSAQINDMASMISRSADEPMLDITTMSDEQLKNALPELEERYGKSELLQDISVNGRILAFAYIRLHQRKEACRTLESVIEKLSVDKDYENTVMEFKEILEQIR